MGNLYNINLNNVLNVSTVYKTNVLTLQLV